MIIYQFFLKCYSEYTSMIIKLKRAYGLIGTYFLEAISVKIWVSCVFLDCTVDALAILILTHTTYSSVTIWS
jgi:hypothetical protein